MLTNVGPTSPMLDMNIDGFRVHTGWVSSTDGLLVYDKNKNGIIDNASEIFGGAGVNGFAALSAYDSNNDGVIDANDTVFSSLRVWRDINGDGVIDPGELQSLTTPASPRSASRPRRRAASP